MRASARPEQGPWHCPARALAPIPLRPRPSLQQPQLPARIVNVRERLRYSWTQKFMPSEVSRVVRRLALKLDSQIIDCPVNHVADARILVILEALYLR